MIHHNLIGIHRSPKAGTNIEHSFIDLMFDKLPSQAGFRLINQLPKGIKEFAVPTQFKVRLIRLLVSLSFQIDQFLPHRSEHGRQNNTDNNSNEIKF